MQSAVGLIETYFVGHLGTDALAGVALVFPIFMLMTMMSAGALGGGISSSVARALGSYARDEAETYAFHAIVLSVAVGLGFGAVFLIFGHPLFLLMGGSPEAIDAAARYSLLLFIGMPAVWVFNGLASILRGSGNMIVPSAVICVGTVLLVPLSPTLIFGWGLVPPLGVMGGGLAILLYYICGSLALFAYFRSGRSHVRLKATRISWRYMQGMLKVGGVGALNTIQTNATAAVGTALFAALGPAGIAAYGLGSRLEYMIIPLGFGLGAPLVALVGTNLGAGNTRRAYRAAWIGAAIGFAITETIGLAAAFFPAQWISLFDQDPVVIEAGSHYLRIVGPFYGLFGIAIVLNLASQGAQRVMWPFLAGSARFLIAAGGGLCAVKILGANLTAVAILMATGMTAMGLINIAAVAGKTWTSSK
jgi:putative MATE family efflux protein